jgi:hypothetical protein
MLILPQPLLTVLEFGLLAGAKAFDDKEMREPVYYQSFWGRGRRRVMVWGDG